MTGFQAAGSAPIFHNRVIPNPETIATAIRIGNPASWQLANNAIRDSAGSIDIVTDAEILSAQQWLASQRRHFRRARQRASIAGLFKLLNAKQGNAPASERFCQREQDRLHRDGARPQRPRYRAGSMRLRHPRQSREASDPRVDPVVIGD